MKWKSQKRVILYGAGYFAGIYYNWANLNQLRVDGLVISDGQDKIYSENMDVPIYFFGDSICI